MNLSPGVFEVFERSPSATFFLDTKGTRNHKEHNEIFFEDPTIYSRTFKFGRIKITGSLAPPRADAEAMAQAPELLRTRSAANMGHKEHNGPQRARKIFFEGSTLFQQSSVREN